MSGFFSSYARIPDATILNGTTKVIIDGVKSFHDAVAVGIWSPATLPETVTIYGHADSGVTNTADAGWMPIQSYKTGALANLVVPAAGTMQTYGEFLPCASIMLVSGINVAADRTFKLTKIYTA